MKILYVNLKYDYGIEERGPNYIGEDGFIRSLINTGNEVIPFYYDTYLDPALNLQLQTDLINFSDKIQPDLIFLVFYTDQIKIETIKYLSSKYKTIGWFGDDTWRFDIHTKLYAPYFTYCITTDKFTVEKYYEIGQKNVILSQWAAIDQHQIPYFDGKYNFDVTFVGGNHPYREWYVKELSKRGIKIETFGHGWPNGVVSPEKMNEIFIKSKINLNISNSRSYDFRYLWIRAKSELLSQKTNLPKIGKILKAKKILKEIISSPKNMPQIKARNFEIPYFGGFQLTDYVPSLEDYFNIGKEIICYKDIDEAEFLIKYYLKNECLRESIRINGHKKAFEEHGYIKRFSQILTQISK
jgi:spore maturation protein CgeB